MLQCSRRTPHTCTPPGGSMVTLRTDRYFASVQVGTHVFFSTDSLRYALPLTLALGSLSFHHSCPLNRRCSVFLSWRINGPVSPESFAPHQGKFYAYLQQCIREMYRRSADVSTYTVWTTTVATYLLVSIALHHTTTDKY